MCRIYLGEFTAKYSIKMFGRNYFKGKPNCRLYLLWIFLFFILRYNFASHAERAAAALNGTKFMGREIRVNIAAPKGSSDLEHKERFRQSKKDV